jgi:type II secretion system protein G
VLRTRPYFTENQIMRRRVGGFTLVELLIVIIIISVLAAIAVPKFASQVRRSKESGLRANLRIVRQALSRFREDCGVWPDDINALIDTSAPSSGVADSGADVPIMAANFRGPYLSEIPRDPLSGSQLLYFTTPPDIGKVKAPVAIVALNGTTVTDW